jgi:hypothetical protein
MIIKNGISFIFEHEFENNILNFYPIGNVNVVLIGI